MGSPDRTRRGSTGLRLLSVLGLSAATMVALLAGCGGAGSGGAGIAGPRRGAPGPSAVAERLTALERESIHQRRAAYVARIRRAVVRGAGRDFATGTGIGGPSFESCVKGLLAEALDGPQISTLVAVYRRPAGSAYAAQALNALAAPLAASCGHRYWVPELVDAAHGLRSGHPTGAAVKRLGVTYGPYLGRRCRYADRGCHLVRIDVVLGHAATRVVAVAGSQRIHLRTPGRHNGIRYRDWVGTFTHAGFTRPGKRPHQELVYVAVELRVRFADGRRADGLFPHVLVSPGSG